MIRRAPREKGFTVLQNYTLEDDRLSWEALGLLSFLLSKPDDWTVSKQHLISCRDAGDHKIKRILRELQDAGYLERQRTQDEEGKFVWESVVYDTPQRDDESIPRKSIDGSSTDGSSIDGKSGDITNKEDNKDGYNKDGESSHAREEVPGEDSPDWAPTLSEAIEATDSMMQDISESVVRDWWLYREARNWQKCAPSWQFNLKRWANREPTFSGDGAPAGDPEQKYMPSSDPDLDV